ncbi:MAG: ABC transporter permease subunit [Coriobacteriia bacterium]|nr:ABC transporter permease subunit [Coriobacteriia bacterium]
MRKRFAKNKLNSLLLLAPTLLLSAIFIYGVVNGILQGFGYMPFLGKTQLTAEYYLKALSRPDFLRSLGFSLKIALVSSSLSLILGVVLSVLLLHARAGKVSRLISLGLPLLSAHTIVALFMVSLFSGAGLISRVLAQFGLISEPSQFSSIVGQPGGLGIILVYLWKEAPFIAFVTLAIMENISQKYQESAALLGASPLVSFFTVTLPLMYPTLAKAFIIVFAFALGSYEIPALLGPTAPKALAELAYMEFQNPDLLNRPYAMAINGLIAGITILLTLLYFKILSKEDKAALL